MSGAVTDAVAPGAIHLDTARLHLRPPRASDAEAIHRLVNDWGVVRMLARLPFPYPRPLTDEWIGSTAEQRSAGTAMHFAITLREGGGELVGCIALRLDGTPRTADLGYWIGRRYWRRGYASEAVARLSSWALAELDIDRLAALVATDNPGSAAVLRRVGFREAGLGRERFEARGGDVAVQRFEATHDDLWPRPAEAEACGKPVGAGDPAGGGGGAGRSAGPGAAGAPSGGKAACRAVGVSGRQDRGGREPRGGAGA